MQYSLHIENFQLSDADRDLLDKKLERLEKRLQTPYTTDVHFSHDTHHNRGDTVRCTINIEQGKKLLHAERTRETAQDALDEVLEALGKELEKQKSKDKAARRD
ncbi:MAG: ribosome-associated translation inhibitor RaiA [Thiomicrospira sp.]